MLLADIIKNMLVEEKAELERLHYVLALTRHSKRKAAIQNEIKTSHKHIERFEGKLK